MRSTGKRSNSCAGRTAEAATEGCSGRPAEDSGKLEDDRWTDYSSFQTGVASVCAEIQWRDLVNPILYVEFQTPLGRLYPDDSDAKKELQTIIEQKLGKSIELHMLVAEDHMQTNLTQITVDQAIRENIHMDVVIEETPGSEPEE